MSKLFEKFISIGSEVRLKIIEQYYNENPLFDNHKVWTVFEEISFSKDGTSLKYDIRTIDKTVGGTPSRWEITNVESNIGKIFASKEVKSYIEKVISSKVSEIEELNEEIEKLQDFKKLADEQEWKAVRHSKQLLDLFRNMSIEYLIGDAETVLPLFETIEIDILKGNYSDVMYEIDDQSLYNFLCEFNSFFAVGILMYHDGNIYLFDSETKKYVEPKAPAYLYVPLLNLIEHSYKDIGCECEGNEYLIKFTSLRNWIWN